MKVKNFVAVLLSAFTLLMAACENPDTGNGNNEPPQMTFNIIVENITTAGADVTVVPSDETALYYFDKVTKAEYDGYKGDNAAFMKAMIENLRAFCKESGNSLASAVSVGDDFHSYNGDLIPGTEYYIFAFALDAKLNPNSNLTLEAFTTEEVQASTNTFHVSVNGGEITVTPSNNDPYFWDMMPTEECQGVSDSDLMNELVSYYQQMGYLDYYIVNGVDSFDYSQHMTPGNSYTVCVFGFNGVPTTALTKYTFTYTGSSSGGGSDSGSETTTLTGDVKMTIASAEAYYYGDYYDIGTNDWEIGLFDSTGNEFVIAEFFTVLSQSTPEGSYTITAKAGDAGTAYSGDLDQEGYILPTYYGKQTSTGDVVDIAMIAAGSFSITKSNANYTVVLNLEDAVGHKVTGNYTGAIKVEMGEVASAQASAGSRANRIAARRALRHFSSVAQVRPSEMKTKSIKALRAK